MKALVSRNSSERAYAPPGSKTPEMTFGSGLPVSRSEVGISSTRVTPRQTLSKIEVDLGAKFARGGFQRALR